ncbi:hypothetical protein EZV62_014416 [Acer yangbiense]|uniref:Carotenoid cleavage dioxygenase 7 n=1 Tax=Acer yangbiense TaxID=1000413 RepID=A0A5C7HRZ8_9ROSI|nr:hypothetical protein EZV62_014416 [Acer yangbiense]
MHTSNPIRCRIIPTKFLSPVSSLPPVRKVTPSVAKPTRVEPITISSPGPDIRVPTGSSDDSIAAAFWDYQSLFVSQRSETTDPIALRVVDGAVPPDFPSGTYFLAGPGIFSDDHGSSVHPLDGHGYVRAFEIDGGGGEVRFMAKYVKTEAHVEEHDKESGTWRFTHRGPFSLLKGGKRFGNTKVMKNVANTSVVKWGGRLLCLWEGGTPYEIESRSLDTVDSFDLIQDKDSDSDSDQSWSGDMWSLAAKVLKPILYGVFNMPPKRLLSHYKIDPRRNRLLMVSCNAEDMLLPSSNFTFYGSMGAVGGLSPMISALSLNPSKTASPIYLLPRFSDEKSVGSRDWRVPVEAPSQMWLLHVGNAFQVKDVHGNSHIQIYASSCSYQWFNFQKLFGYDWQSGRLDPSIMNVKEKELLPHLVQVSINLDSNGNCQKCSVETLNEWKNPSDFPIINPLFSGNKNSCMYAATSSGSRQNLPHFPFDTVVKLNVVTKSSSTWSVGPRTFIGEPIFVSKGIEEDDGYLLVVEYAVSIQRCFLVILNPKRIGEDDALVVRLEVPGNFNFPLGFHGFWATSN